MTYEKGKLALLSIKDSDMRLSILHQADTAIDRGVHIGGAFSAVVPLVALYHGGVIRCNPLEPASRDQDTFILSKGHAVAALAAVYADLGYFDKSLLENSRSFESILNGHPGPVLPGIPISTGPLGQGLSAAVGLASANRGTPSYDSYVMTGDGELQEGNIWEAVQFAGGQGLDNLCMIVDRNFGQLDDSKKLLLNITDLATSLEGFGWNVVEVDARGYEPVLAALEEFAFGERDGRPTAILCEGYKGQGGYADITNKHKITLSADVYASESELQNRRRTARVEEFLAIYEMLEEEERAMLREDAEDMMLSLSMRAGKVVDIKPAKAMVRKGRAEVRDKKVTYNPAALPAIDPAKNYVASDIVAKTIQAFGLDPKVVTLDADLSSTSGLQPGMMQVDATRAINVGIAEANMMGMAEAYASLGYNVWASTFCPFFDLRVLRRIAIGQQERFEGMEGPHAWLSEGHGLDITLLATAANFDTQTNGATHMGNDDVMFLEQMPLIRIIDTSCPRQLLSILRWIAEGDRGIVYLRIMRAASAVLYGEDYAFEYGKATWLTGSDAHAAVIVTSGRAVHEAMAASKKAAEEGLSIGVVDMPSYDPETVLALAEAGTPVLFAEQNNGYLWSKATRTLFQDGRGFDPSRMKAVNLLDKDGKPQFVHSGTYKQLTAAYRLDAAGMLDAVHTLLG
jgi:transketolase N-terminal domain/subunit/transketolase C-terminal domain/subunit